MSRALVATLVLIATVTAAQATTFASGKLYGGPSQNAVACYILNLSPKTVPLSSVTITGEDGNAAPLAAMCPASLAAHAGCFAYSDTVSTTSAYDCIVTTGAPVTHLRGSIEIRQVSDTTVTVLQVQPVR